MAEALLLLLLLLLLRTLRTLLRTLRRKLWEEMRGDARQRSSMRTGNPHARLGGSALATPLPRGMNFKLRGESEAQGVELFYSQLTAVELRQVGGRDIGVPAERARAGDG